MTYDLKIVGVSIVDGTGRERFRGDMQANFAMPACRPISLATGFVRKRHFRWKRPCEC